MKAPWLKDALLGININTVLTYDDQSQMGRFIAQTLAQPIEPGLAFSQAVGVWTACKRVTFIGKQTKIQPLKDIPVTDEMLLLTQDPISQTLTELLGMNAYRLLFEMFMLMSQKGIKLPAFLLPKALDAGRRNTELRPALFKVLGTRGVWLAHFNNAWKYAALSIESTSEDNDKRLWEEGTLVQREIFFKNLRLKNPEYASALLYEQIGKLQIKERQRFLELLELNLSLNDEKLLNNLLKDRSRDIRQKAATLLMQLPDSVYAQTVISYMQNLVTYKKGLFKSIWQCNAPQEFNPEWEKLGIIKEVPALYSSGDERSWWLLQLVSKTPLNWWHTYTGMQPEELMQWSQSTDWKQELQQGWLESIALQDSDWIILLLQRPEKNKMGHLCPSYKLQNLLSKLSIEQWEKVIANLPGNIAEHYQTIGTAISNLPFGQMLSTQLSLTILSTLKKEYEKGNMKNKHNFFLFYQQAMTVISSEALEQFELIVTHANATENEIQWINDLEQTVRFRILMRKQLSNNG